MSNRLEREQSTVQLMIGLYCKDHHHSAPGLCPECQELSDYAMNRLAHCKFGERKPTCGKCTVHCYRPDRRNRIQEVMRYVGPKMVFTHPIIGLRHFIDGLKS